jgi:transposase-like protein
MPLERCAFKREIAREIFERYDSSTNTMGDICREYGISYTQVYRLWYAGQKVKLEKETPSLDFQ